MPSSADGRDATPRELRRTAYHEAGHAVMCWMEGDSILDITIRPDKGYLGLFRHNEADELDLDGYGPEIRDYRPGELGRSVQKMRLIRIGMAGGVAEHLLLNTERTHTSSGDCENIRSGMEGMPAFRDDQTVKAWLRWVELTVRDDLRHKWLVVEALAEALLEGETLDKEEAIRIIREANQKHYPVPRVDEDEEQNSETMPVSEEGLPF